MSNTITAELSRLVVKAPERTFEIAVPADVPLAELMPSLVHYAAPEGADLDESGLEHGGWVVQRLGADALDEDATPAELGLRDGETLYLRPRREQLPPVHFDDLVDGVAVGMRERADLWRPELTRRLLLGVAGAVLAAGFAALASAHAPLLQTAAAAGTAVLLLLGAAAASRAVGDSAAGTVLGVAVIPYLALAGWLLPTGPEGPELIGARLLAASAAAAGGAVLAVATVAAAAPLFCALLLVSLLGALTGVLGLTAGLTLAAAAGPVAVLAVLLGAFVPMLSFRLAGLRLPPLPTNAEQLQEGIEPLSSRDVLDRTAIADRYMTGLYAGTGAVCAASLTALSTGSGWPPFTLGGVLSLLLVLHGRAMNGAWQRLSAVLPGVYGGVLLMLAGIWEGGTAARCTVLAVSLVAGAALVGAAWSIPGRRLIPYWGRAADLLHSLAAAALLPLVLVDLGVLSALRGLWS
ncbi:type VII secretion integral membrane protein EccD [Streptomyces sp. x-80]|uniref:type VII secretion integral membrane protein EccD n=1 Tax=Streptomyces sp. x-80 TaxID=2789282 RepID=UPI003980E8FE